MDDLLKSRLKQAKEIREKLAKEGYNMSLEWKDVEHAMIFNYNQYGKGRNENK